MAIAARLKGAAPEQVARSRITTLDFDDVPTNAQGTLAIPDGYGNLQWDRFAAVKRSDAEAQLGTGTGYTTGNVSGEQVAFFGGDAILGTISSGSAADFAVRSVYLTSAYRDNETVTITGYDDGVIRYVRTVTVGNDAPLFVNLAMNNVDRVVFAASGGTPTATGGHVVLDDLRVNTSAGSISGTMFNDRNGNGARNSRDEAVADRLVYIDGNNNGLFDLGERRTRSAADGSYTFANVPFGEYDVSFAPGRGQTATTQELDRYRYTFFPGQDTSFYPGQSTLVTPRDADGDVDLDEGVYVMNLTTPIELWGNTYSTLYISVNGLIEFDAISPSNFENTALPNAAFGPIIAPFWTDLTFEYGGALLVKEDGVTGQVVVTWSNVRYYSGPSTTTNTFQVVINPDGKIDLHYSALGAIPSGDTNGVTIGVQGDPEDGARTYTMGTAVPTNSEIIFAPYVEQTYGVAHVIVDAGSAVTEVNFGATRIAPTAFGEDRPDAQIGLPTHWSSLYVHTSTEHVMLV